MASDKTQMIQLSDVQASFMLASPAAFSVSVGHVALLCLWYAEMPWRSSASCSESERGKKGGSSVHVLVTEPLGSFREDVKEKSLLPSPAHQPPSS